MQKIAYKKETLLDVLKESIKPKEYLNNIWEILCQCFPEDDLFSDFTDPKIRNFFINRFEESLPYFRHRVKREEGSLSVRILCQKRFESGKFIYDMFSRWLLPGRRIGIELFFTANFQLFQRTYTVYEIIIKPRMVSDLEIVGNNFLLLEREIHLGLLSIYHARKILEIKGFTADEKIALVQEKVSSLIAKFSKWFDYDLFSEMQHFLVTCSITFKESRSYVQMCRIIVTQYLFRKSIEKKQISALTKRHFEIKCRNSELHHPLGIKNVVSLHIGLNFLKEHEALEKSHIEKALHNHNPSIRLIEDSYLENETREPQIHLYYLEVEKASGELFSLQEIKSLKEALFVNLETHIECLVHPLFMPRNEEEILKNAVLMSRELKYSKDIPQIMISFDEQIQQKIGFTVILARVLLPAFLSFEQTLQLENFPYTLTIDRVKVMGAVRKKHAKEIAIFRIKLSSDPFLRDDHSLDLFRARQCVFSQLEKVFGQLRDFNGGMLGKQMEVFKRLKKCLSTEEGNLFLLENFFHGLYPIEMKAMVPLEKLLRFFRIFQDILKQTRGSDPDRMHFINESNHLVYFYVTKDDSIKSIISSKVKQLNFPRFYLLRIHLSLFGLNYFGGMIFEEESSRREQLIDSLTFGK